MHWVEVDGVRLPRRVAGDVALDFCNTVAGWNEPVRDRRDWLDGYELLVRWAVYADVLEPSQTDVLLRAARRRPGAARTELGRARALRRAVHRVASTPGGAAALRTVTAFGREAASHGSLVADGAGARWTLGRSAGLARPTLAVARAAEAFLTGTDLSTVKACPGAGCGWLFVDRSGRRRWCSMADCGNRAKVAAFARRRHG